MSEQQDWKFLGDWPQGPFSSSLWADWWNEEIINLFGITLEPPAIAVINEGKVMVDFAQVQKLKKFLETKDSNFWKTLNDSLASLLKTLAEENIEHSDLVSSYKHFITNARAILAIWGMGALMAQAAQLIWNERFTAAEGITYSEHIPKIKTLFSDFHDAVENAENKGEDFSEILTRFAWIKTVNFEIRGLSMTDIEGVLRPAHHAPSTQIPLEQQEFLHLFSLWGFCKQLGAEYFSKFSYEHKPLLDRIAAAFSLSYEELLRVPYFEIQSALEEKRSPKQYGKRWLLLRTENGVEIKTSEDELAAWDNLIPKIPDTTSTLKGTVAFPGKVTGKATLVLTMEDAGRFTEGDILVTTMTTPDFLPIMHASSAILTEIGGLLCHAAIVSRELKIPCVIGIQHLTQILKDGDMVEVDADSGVITILS